MRTGAIAGAGILALVMMPALAGQQGEDSAAKASTGAKIPVVAATHLVDRDLRDLNGNRSGEIKFLMVDVESGKLRYAVVSPEEPESEGLTPVPWEALEISRRGDGIRVATKRDQISAGPRYTAEELSEVTRPSVLTRVYGYWAPVMPAGTESEAGAGGESAKRSGEGGSGSGGAEADASGGRSAGGEEGLPHVLVGRGIMATIMAPRHRFAEQIEGSVVRGADGEELGDIDELMIDIGSGKVAYVQIAQGGFLGVGEEVTPVPFAVLKHAARDNSYRLSVKADVFADAPRMVKGEPPASVRRRDLEELYRHFRVEPYWGGKAG